MVDDEGADPALRAFNERVQRGEELTPAERKQYAELVNERLHEVCGELRRAASPVIAEVDQIAATVKALRGQLERLVNDHDGLSWVPAETTRQLFCDLLEAAEEVLFGAHHEWESRDFRVTRKRINRLGSDFAHCNQRHVDDLAQWAAEDRLAGEAESDPAAPASVRMPS